MVSRPSLRVWSFHLPSKSTPLCPGKHCEAAWGPKWGPSWMADLNFRCREEAFLSHTCSCAMSCEDRELRQQSSLMFVYPKATRAPGILLDAQQRQQNELWVCVKDLTMSLVLFFQLLCRLESFQAKKLRKKYPPNPRIKPWSPALQTDSLPSEPPGKLELNGGRVTKFLSNGA